jgi:glycosyltransferase involved in cell wall biosynthesis
MRRILSEALQVKNGWVSFKTFVRLLLKHGYLRGLYSLDSLRTADLSIFHEMKPPPNGGGNQFLLALWRELERSGLRVEGNRVSRHTRACLFNSFNFDEERLRQLKRAGCRMVHRVDGPVGVYRNRDDGVDGHVWALNKEFADATVFQSVYSLNKHHELGLVFKEPVVIHNAVDPAIFYSQGRQGFGKSGKIRLFSMSWSDNPNKGAGVYKWLEDHLDWNLYEYTFVGRSPITFERIRMMPPVASEAIANIMRQQDVFITASQHESCSNALIEALSCGLPAIYIKSGSNEEIAGSGGVGFELADELPGCLDQLISNYSVYQRAIHVPDLSDVAHRYQAVLGLRVKE